MNLTKNIKTINIDYKISTEQIESLDALVYKDQQHKIQTIFCKPTDQQIYLRTIQSSQIFQRQYSIQPSVTQQDNMFAYL